MKRARFIQALVGFVLNPVLFADQKQVDVKQLTPKEEWDIYATDAQKTFARKCIHWGEFQEPARGHTLGALAWNETSLAADTDHGEPSYGPFGMSLGTAQHIRKNLRKDPDEGDLEAFSDDTVILLLKDDFYYAAKMTLWLFDKHMKWFLVRGFRPTLAWKYAAQKYAGWKKWATRKDYGDTFAARAKFLKTIKTGESDDYSDERG